MLAPHPRCPAMRAEMCRCAGFRVFCGCTDSRVSLFFPGCRVCGFSLFVCVARAVPTKELYSALRVHVVWVARAGVVLRPKHHLAMHMAHRPLGRVPKGARHEATGSRGSLRVNEHIVQERSKCQLRIPLVPISTRVPAVSIARCHVGRHASMQSRWLGTSFGAPVAREFRGRRYATEPAHG